jgi:hypothetical protein
MSAKVQMIVINMRINGKIRFEYNNGRIHDDKSISQYSAPTLAINVR